MPSRRRPTIAVGLRDSALAKRNLMTEAISELLQQWAWKSAMVTGTSDMSSTDYEFDIAISFHTADQALARQFANEINHRFKTFIFMDEQERLAATNGETAFNEIFEKKARIVVVFIRKEWGETKFTRVERDAIQNRSHRQAYEAFTIFIPTDEPKALPPWVPKTSCTGTSKSTECRVWLP
jgi:hypothetical protein